MPITNVEQPRHRAAHQAAQTHSPTAQAAPALPATLWLFPAAVLGGFVLLAALLARFRRRKPVAAVRRYAAAESLLTPAELHFWQTLRAAVGPRAHVSMKVRQADILHVAQGGQAAFNGVSQKHVDFLLCHPETLKPLVAVELDDRSHGRAARRARDEAVDEAFQSAGVPLVHVPVAGRYEVREVGALVEKHLASVAP